MNKIFTRKDIAKAYFLHPEDRKWLNNMIRKGYFIRLNSKPPYRYNLSIKAKEFISTIENWRIDLNKLMTSKDTTDLFWLRQKLKRNH